MILDYSIECVALRKQDRRAWQSVIDLSLDGIVNPPEVPEYPGQANDWPEGDSRDASFDKARIIVNYWERWQAKTWQQSNTMTLTLFNNTGNGRRHGRHVVARITIREDDIIIVARRRLSGMQCGTTTVIGRIDRIIQNYESGAHHHEFDAGRRDRK